ncbi:hypothetical protein GCM10010346_27820 [Streptomyces chryseus]|uniref:Uncharacterized protein n=1 Tax=Streptomyces chryseus TaxID=68186 RepID=A0ABQ3DMK9_9ACTN|nr:hypothetical protein GCM10010346_27820 [Streptomyces chryseus]
MTHHPGPPLTLNRGRPKKKRPARQQVCWCGWVWWLSGVWVGRGSFRGWCGPSLGGCGDGCWCDSTIPTHTDTQAGKWSAWPGDLRTVLPAGGAREWGGVTRVVWRPPPPETARSAGTVLG